MSMLNTIGNTPLKQIGGIWCKLEMANPTGSIKDRIAHQMILAANVPKGGTIVEATSGNTGVSIAFVAACLGLKSIIYCPFGTTQQKIQLMLSYGAAVHDQYDDGLSEHTYAPIHSIEQAQYFAKLCAKITNNTYYLDQFSNKSNLKAQINMATEIKQFLTKDYVNMCFNTPSWDIKVFHSYFPDCIVAGTGTGGTLAGLHAVFPDADVYQVLPKDGQSIEGIADGVDTPLLKGIDFKTIKIDEEIARATAIMLCKKYGVNCGTSSGGNYAAAMSLKKKYDNIVTVFSDAGWRYK